MGYKGHYGEYSGNAKWSKNHADTEVTKSNYKASERDDAAHIDYLKRDVDYDNKHGHSDSSMTNDEKHISKLAGDMKYDKEHHGSPGKMVSPVNRSENWYKRKENRHTNLVEKGKDEKAAKLRTKIDKSKEFDKHKKDGTVPPKEYGDNLFTTLKRN